VSDPLTELLWSFVFGVDFVLLPCARYAHGVYLVLNLRYVIVVSIITILQWLCITTQVFINNISPIQGDKNVFLNKVFLI